MHRSRLLKRYEGYSRFDAARALLARALPARAMPARAPSTLVILACALVASACILPEFSKVGSDRGNTSTNGDAAIKTPGEASITGGSAECKSCIASQCSDPLAQCGGDCSGLSLPINPATPAPDAITPFLGCLQQNCEEVCEVTWGCVGKYRWPQPEGAFTIDLRVADLISSTQRLAGTHVSACLSSDPGCTAGSGLVSEGITDATGHVLLTVPRNFVGYFLIDGTDSYMSAVAFWSQPSYWIDMTTNQAMVSLGVADYLGQGVEATVDRKASHLIFQALNCLPLRYSGNADVNAEADDVKISYTPPGKNSSQVFYTITGNAIDRSRDSTSASGASYGGVFNLPSQTLTVIGMHAGKEVSRAAVQMRAGAVGFVYLLPNAR